ncbi:Phosphopantetheine attachment site [Micromonospora pallida]|uniref:Phosphopantetheine attachment site n=1 Tax=Micromonospora pallida TaxID=145854 RepID=A0A1C6RW80_9ACTN|nr:condensation domain-containing protein [Micromonospora pallida]SCL21425.1 Phosphopantetheine attachment site [Micromonospora pallida]
MTGPESADAPLFPASSAQRQLWFLEQIYPGRPLNNLNVELRPAGTLRPDPLRAALTALVDRHEALRTTFHQRDGALHQAIAAQAGEVDLSVSDLRDLTGEQARDRLAELRQRDAAALFDLATGPLLRVRLIHLPGNTQVMILVVHHIVADATSIGVLTEDLAALYAHAAEGTDPGLPPLRIQYLDYAVWQQKKQEQAKAAEALEWWRAQLADLPTVELAPGRRRPTEALDSGGWYAEDWDAAFVHDLRAVARTQATTLFAVLLAGYAVLLNQHTGGTDLPVGTPVLGRPTAELRRVVGLFVNMLVLRMDVSGDPSFGELLARARRTVQDALAHEDTPFERIVGAVARSRTLGVTALFQVGINMVPVPPPAPAGQPAFLSEGTEFSNGTAKYDLFLTFNERPDGGLQVVVEWRRGLLADRTARGLPRQLRRILSAALADPRTPVTALPVADPSGVATAGADLDGADLDAADLAVATSGSAAGLGAGLPADERPASDTPQPVPPIAQSRIGLPPLDQVEEVLADVFGRVLGHPSVDRTTSFFALGGDSVASLRLVGLAAEAGLEILPSDVFLHQTVAELARAARLPAAQTPTTPDDGSDQAGVSKTESTDPAATDVGGHRASDFPDSGLSQDQLDRMMARLAAASGPRRDDQPS